MSAPERGAPRFRATLMDDRPDLLEQSYRLRYQVYCRERSFLRADDYPDGLELDEFDRHAHHVGAIDERGEVVGTARIVAVSSAGLPLFRHCELFPQEMKVQAAGAGLVEVGRLAVSRNYRLRRTDLWSLARSTARSDRAPANDRRSGPDGIFRTILRGVYQESKRMGALHWLAATEPPLQRMLIKRGFPFRLVGPAADYFGPVAPYRMDIDELDERILSGRFAGLDDFLVGLEPEFRPRGSAAVTPAAGTGVPVRHTPRLSEAHR
jgi:N-acyl amino acid synthase of PEP-CTERM/exosortase system